MKSKAKLKLSVLRMVLSEIKYAQAAVNAHEDLPEATVEKIVATYHKRLTKSVEDFPDEAKKEEIRAEIAIVEQFLPKKASTDEVEAAIDSVMGETEDRNFGVLMKAVLARLGSSADGKIVSQLIKKKLA
jgi:hypothetical protein